VYGMLCTVGAGRCLGGLKEFTLTVGWTGGWVGRGESGFAVFAWRVFVCDM
jgi:hypothetical protein